ncbi:MAG: class I SAM-dependent methyltransferase [Firmicutes bacterium]|nr:class I SAM-dependent methyltransferase [Bacillota bacterium]
MAQYFDNVDLKSNIKKIDVTICGVSLRLNTDNGVFSKDKLDFGTRTLLENILLDDFCGKVLDVGCGYGSIGLYLRKTTACSVDMCDVNRRCLHLAKMNAKENNLDVNIFESDCYQNVTDKYQVIITNPPIRAGKKVVYDILMGAKEHLVSGGVLYCVIHKDQGAKSTVSDLEKIYNVSIIEKNKGFFVIKCTNR